MLRNIARNLIPPLLWQGLRRLRVSPSPVPAEAPLAVSAPETFDYYANASLYALEKLRSLGRLDEMRLLSVTSRIGHLADYVALFREVYHSTMVETRLPPLPDPARLHLLQGDCFELAPFEFDCVISHSTIHCLSDTRYGNAWRPATPALARPYQFGALLRRLMAPRRVPCFLTVAVNHRENLTDNDVWLAHDTFVRSFTDEGFTLRDCFFDLRTGGALDSEALLAPDARRAKVLPPESPALRYVAGTYFFQ